MKTRDRSMTGAQNFGLNKSYLNVMKKNLKEKFTIYTTVKLNIECHVGPTFSQKQKRTPRLMLLSTPALRGRVNGQRSFLIPHIVKIQSTGPMMLS